MSKLLKGGVQSEYSIQTYVVKWLRLQPLLKRCFFSIPNESPRNIVYAAKLKRMGMRAGVSDIFIAKACRGYHGMYLELKSAEGHLSPYQIEFIKDMQQEDYYTAVCYSENAALNQIEWYIGKTETRLS